MNEIDSQVIELDKETSPSRDTRFFQIDFLKAIMIFLVIFDHMVNWNIKNLIGVALWERISIPVFLVILGFNMGHSFRRHGEATLKQLYSWGYFKRKILRYIVPFAILYGVSTFIGLFMYGFDFELMYNNQYVNHGHGFINLFYLYMPFWGPGNWFIPVLLQSIVIVPILYWGFTKKPVLTLILTFVVEIFLQIVAFLLIGAGYDSWEEVYTYTLIASSLPYYLSAVGLGLWFSFGHKLISRRNIFIWILLPISLWYIIAYQFFAFHFTIDSFTIPFLGIEIEGGRFLRGDYHLLVFPYSAFLVLLALNLLPKTSKSWISRKISLISNSTYHILLTQILGYGMITAWWGTHYLMDSPFNPYDLIDLVAVWILFVWFGVGWYKIDNQKDIFRKILYYLNFFILFACTLLFIFWLQGFWIPISLFVIMCYAIAAFIVHLTIKRPLPRNIVLVWTAFLVCSFFVMILQVYVLPPSYYSIVYVFMLIFFIYAACFTSHNRYVE